MKERRWLRWLVAASCVVGASCADPVHEGKVSALGPEPAGPGPGPLHRPGQPCVVCHDGSGPGRTQFVIAGTIFQVKGQRTPQPDALVQLVDAKGAQHSSKTNQAGNFYITSDEWQPVPPLHVTVAVGENVATMRTHIGRDGSCGACHYDPPGPTTNGIIYMYADPADVPGASP